MVTSIAISRLYEFMGYFQRGKYSPKLQQATVDRMRFISPCQVFLYNNLTTYMYTFTAKPLQVVSCSEKKHMSKAYGKP